MDSFMLSKSYLFVSTKAWTTSDHKDTASPTGSYKEEPTDVFFFFFFKF